MLIAKSKLGQSGLYVRVLHKQVPKQSGAIIFNHHHDRSLVNRQVRFGIPERTTKRDQRAVGMPPNKAVLAQMHGEYSVPDGTAIRFIFFSTDI